MQAIKTILKAALVASTASAALLVSPAATSWPTIASARAQSAVTLDNIVLDFALQTYRVPRLEVIGSPLSRADLLGILDAKSTEPLARRLARLDAREIVAPELIVEQKVGADKQSITYRDVRLTDVRGGRIARMTSAGGVLAAQVKDAPPVKGVFGRAEVQGFDLVQTTRVYMEKAGATPEPLKPLYDRFGFDGLEITTGDGGTFRIGRISGEGFSGRPTSQSWLGTVGLLEKLEKSGAAVDDDDKSAAVKSMVEFLSAFSMGTAEIADIAFTAPKEADDARGRIASISLASKGPSGASEMIIRNFEVTAKSGSARVASIGVTGFSIEPTLEGLTALADKPLADLETEDFRKLVPTLGTVRVSGVDFDVPNSGSRPAKGQKPENIKFSLKGFEITADKPVNGVPTNVRFAMDNLAFPVPANTREEGLKNLVALGYKDVDVSWLMHASWNEPGSELLVRELSFSGLQMGSVALRGTLGNITRDVFEGDSAVAMVALLGATAKTLHLSLEDRGFAERFLAAEGKKRRRSAEELRKEFGSVAAFGLPAMLGNSASAKAITQAVSRFIAKPGRLEMSARAKDAAGLGVADVMVTGGSPQAILEQIEVTATAE
jgi:hypothetical protein